MQNHFRSAKWALYNEYWIVNPMRRVVQIYSPNNDGQYEQAGVWKETGMACSRALDSFSVDIEQLFRP
nr:Uma2 family endonuclease [Geobacillus sp. 46C-IIa]